MRAIFLLCLLSLPAQALEGEITRAVDGDTIIVNGERVRIWGIDSPETDTPEGKAAKAWAVENWTGIQVDCHVLDVDRYGRSVARCIRDRRWDIAWDIIHAGHANDWPKYSRGYYGLN